STRTFVFPVPAPAETKTTSSSARSTLAASFSSRPVPGRGRRRSLSSASPEPYATKGSTASRSSSAPTPRRPPAARAPGLAAADGLRRMLTGIYETLRSAGRELVLELGERPSLAARVDELREAARCLAEDEGSGSPQRETARRSLVFLEQDTRADRLFDLGDLRRRG